MRKLLGLLLVAAAAVSCATGEFKAMSFNLRYSTPEDGENCWDNRKEAVVKMVAAERPVVMGTQECLPVMDDYLIANLPGYGHTGVDRDERFQKMALYYDTTRVELTSSGMFWLSETPDSVSFGWDAACIRNAVWGCFRFKDSGKEFYHFNTHLDHVGPVARQEEVKLIVAKIHEIVPEGVPFIITGDMNSASDEAIHEPFKAVAVDVRSAAPVTDSKSTYQAYGKTETKPIDHIYASGMECISFRTVDDNWGVPFISDHYPVEAVLKF